ncbi:hypothetical protein DRJ22_01050 [Candidatus Woesearchaeota archaeon]|nr:MAG: hypothetical protein DRJ22_01050 [Candidatus Woesearchaeota archaeon]
MAYFIIIRGALGIGKTTIAKRLAKKLKAEYISIDFVLEKNDLDKVDERLGCISAKNFIKCNKIVIPKITEFLEKDKIVVIDGCFYHKEQIEDLLKKLKFKNFVFTLKAPLDICFKRDSKRKKFYGEKAAKEVFKLVSKFDYGTVIDTENKSEEEVVEEILKQLPTVK